MDVRGVAEQKHPVLAKTRRLSPVDAQHRRPSRIAEPERVETALVNLAGEPIYAEELARLHLELERRLDLPAIGERVRASQRDRRRVSQGLAHGAPTRWDYEPRVDASMQYVRSRADLYELQRRARMEEQGGAISGSSAAGESPG